MRISFVIPAYTKDQQHLKMLMTGCIGSFVAHNGPGEELIVVEDAGPLGEQVRAVCATKGVHFFENKKNSGFAASVNKGIKEATGDIICLVNNDVQFTQPVAGAIARAFASDEKIGVVGGLLMYPHGTIQHGGIVSAGRGFTHRGWHRTLGQASEVQYPSYMIGVTGALFAIRRKAAEDIGLFNENYFLSCEDTEYCLRAWTKGWRVFYSPAIKAVHAEGHTRGKTDVEKIQKHREWYLKEMSTWGKFQDDLANYDLARIHDEVALANSELVGAGGAGMQDGADRIEFEGSTVTESGQRAPTGPKILVRRTGALGDVLMATGVIRKLKRDNPSSQIIVSTICGDVLKNNPNVSQVVRSPDGITADRFFDLDLVYEMNPKFPVWEAYARSVFGESGFDLTPEMFSTESDYSTIRAKMGSFDPDKDRIVVMHMGVSWPSRTWPRHMWAEAARRLAGSGHRVVVVGRGGDFRADLFTNVLNLVDYVSPHEVRELCKRAVAFVGPDSGMMHVAQTTDVPIVGLFTCADPRLRVVARPSRTVALVPRSDCRFCLHDQPPPVTYVECRYKTNHCLTEITVEDVVKEALSIARRK